MDTEVGIRELKRNLSAYLRQVKAGRTITITDRGRPVGRIVPFGRPTLQTLEALQKGGLVAWSGKKLLPSVPVGNNSRQRHIVCGRPTRSSLDSAAPTASRS